MCVTWYGSGDRCAGTVPEAEAEAETRPAVP